MSGAQIVFGGAEGAREVEGNADGKYFQLCSTLPLTNRRCQEGVVLHRRSKRVFVHVGMKDGAKWALRRQFS